MLVFELSNRRFALPVEQVREVLPRAALTPLPGAPIELAGMLRLRGSLLPVVSLDLRLGLPPARPRISHRIVVAAAGHYRVGFLVDEVHGLLDSSAVVGQDADAGPERLMVGLVNTPEHLVTVLDAEVAAGPRVMAFIAPLAEDRIASASRPSKASE
jgi:purine-binding chemotaxis protein CheW